MYHEVLAPLNGRNHANSHRPAKGKAAIAQAIESGASRLNRAPWRRARNPRAQAPRGHAVEVVVVVVGELVESGLIQLHHLVRG